MKTILIPVETRTREFIGKLHLATNLAMSGHKVIIGRKGEINSIALRSQSCYLVTATQINEATPN